MHNRPRVKPEQIDKIKEEAKRQKIAKYNELKKLVLGLRQQKLFNENGEPIVPAPFNLDEVMQYLEKLLIISPEFLTLWNFRREIIDYKIKLAPEDTKLHEDLYRSELAVTERILKEEHVKSYGTWHHRKLNLMKLGQKDWERDLVLCAKLLEVDERNFHCWNYRRFVYKLAHPNDSETELNFLRKQIESKPHNYSAWHNRSALLKPDDEKVLEEELELATNAFFTDPNDQSSWIYHRWIFQNENASKKLIETDLNTCKDLLEIEPDSKWGILTVVWLQLTSQKGGLVNEESEEQVASSIRKLISIDPGHKGYYTDLLSDFLINQNCLKQQSPTLSMPNSNLTRFTTVKRFPTLTSIDLSHNLISSLSFLSAGVLPNLEVLILNNNKIQYVENLSNLPKLKVVKLANNEITKIEYVNSQQEEGEQQVVSTTIEELDLSGNPITSSLPSLNKYFPALKTLGQ